MDGGALQSNCACVIHLTRGRRRWSGGWNCYTTKNGDQSFLIDGQQAGAGVKETPNHTPPFCMRYVMQRWAELEIVISPPETADVVPSAHDSPSETTEEDGGGRGLGTQRTRRRASL